MKGYTYDTVKEFLLKDITDPEIIKAITDVVEQYKEQNKSPEESMLFAISEILSKIQETKQ